MNLEKNISFQIIIALFICSFTVTPYNIFPQSKEVAITTSSDEALSFFLEGRHKYENIQYVTAASLFDEAINADSNFAMAYLYRSRSGGGFNTTRRNLDKAVSLIDKVTEGEKHTILFYKAFAEGDDIKQKENIEFLLKNFPDDKRVHFNAGVYYDFITDYPTALMHYIDATRLDKNYAAAYNKIGYCFFDLEYFNAAEEAFKTYIKLIPDSPNPYDSYAELLLKTGRYNESIVQYKNAYKKDLFFTLALAGIGHNYLFKGNYAKAREYYQKEFIKASSLNEKLDALRWESISYVHEDSIDKALSILTQLRALAEKENSITDVIDSYNSAGLILTEAGFPDKGMKEYSKAEEIINFSDLPGKVKEKLLLDARKNHCYVLISKNDLSNAKRELNEYKTIVDKRDSPIEIRNYHQLSALFESKKGNYVKALDEFSKSDTDDPFNWYYMADAYQKLGYIETASELLVKLSSWNENTLGYALVRLHTKS